MSPFRTTRLCIIAAFVSAALFLSACDSNKDEEVEIEDLVVGEGAMAEAGKCLNVHYTGWLENGTKFYSTVDTGKPIQFQLGFSNVIEGWHMGVEGMRVGGVRRLTIPPSLAFGSAGTNSIPPNATVIYEIKLLEIVDLQEGAPCKGGELPSVQIEDVEVGEGAIAIEGQCLNVHYTGWLENGTKFDSSVDRNQPFRFRLGVSNVIEGWHQGITGMRIGGKRKLIIPPHLGYGNRGWLVGLPNNATLTFEIELLDILAPPQDAACNA